MLHIEICKINVLAILFLIRLLELSINFSSLSRRHRFRYIVSFTPEFTLFTSATSYRRRRTKAPSLSSHGLTERFNKQLIVVVNNLSSFLFCLSLNYKIRIIKIIIT